MGKHPDRRTVFMIIPNLSYGGAQQSFVNISQTLADQFEVYRIVFNKTGIDPGYSSMKNLVSLEVYPSPDLFHKLISFFRRVIKLRALKREYRPFWSISFLEGADYVNVLSRLEDKIILSVRGSKVFDQNITGWIGRLRHKILIPYLYNQSDIIVVLNTGIKAELKLHYKIKRPIKVIHNFVDQQATLIKSSEQIDQDEITFFTKPVLVSHGRLEKEKGYAQLIEVIAEIQHDDFRFLVIGTGSELERLKLLCEKKNIRYCDCTSGDKIEESTVVVFKGYSANPFIYLIRSTCFILPSLHEGFGNSLLEAMACGLPVLASDCPYGPGEILRKGESNVIQEFGVLLPLWEDDPTVSDAWKSAIRKMFTDRELRIKYSALSALRVLDFSKEDIMSGWFETLALLSGSTVTE